ncbi:type VI secretion system lipoprotein TssJ [Teredinibacter haidensis]|uniref:type VI secretion system lipoprotein TssJ n=1 Tax=Teredinibacter haidensis TaxID=2731755 RepID=UPI000B1CF06A|nr:type VI secretion system lipoprotein TssJ [Teredinibacter haidensis]
MKLFRSGAHFFSAGMCVAVATAVVLLLFGCSAGGSKVGGMLNLDTDLKLELQISSDVNPDERGKPSPLFVRFYELKSPKLFNKSDFIDIFERDEEVLEADLISKQELRRVTPGSSRTEKFVLSQETRYIALFAEFYDYKNSKYKIIFPVTANNIFRNTVKIEITGNKIILVDD